MINLRNSGTKIICGEKQHVSRKKVEFSLWLFRFAMRVGYERRNDCQMVIGDFNFDALVLIIFGDLVLALGSRTLQSKNELI